jgi:hypothetical protein
VNVILTRNNLSKAVAAHAASTAAMTKATVANLEAANAAAANAAAAAKAAAAAAALPDSSSSAAASAASSAASAASAASANVVVTSLASSAVVEAAAAPAAPAADLKPDGTLDRLLKLVPGDVIAGYTALLAIGASVDKDVVRYATPVALLACTILVIIGIRNAGASHSPPVAPHPAQYIIAVLAFWAWGITIRDPLAGWNCAIPTWIPAFATVLIPTFGALLLGGGSATTPAPDAPHPPPT